MSVWVELGGERYERLTWRGASKGGNVIGPSVNWALPDVEDSRLVLHLDCGALSSRYELCYRPLNAGKPSRQMNV